MLKPLLLGIVLLSSSNICSAQTIKSLKWSDLRPANTQQDIKSRIPIHQFADESVPAAKQISPEAPVVKELDGQLVRIPGYIVPLAMTDKQQITEFLLVPYLGACIHVPPPPSNQIVYVKNTVPLRYIDSFDPYWVQGILHVTPMTSELAETGYFLESQRLTLYQIDDN